VNRTTTFCATLLAAGLGFAGGEGGAPLVASAETVSARRGQAAPQRGEASYYAERFHGRRMANGARFDRNSRSAAHRSLPLGTVVRVTNLENGRSEVVTIEDRGPYAKGRIIDLSPRTAERLAMKHQGTARVAVTPLQRPEEGATQQASRDD
jgi:rare lipoprotein A